jgi:hypothetical protein
MPVVFHPLFPELIAPSQKKGQSTQGLEETPHKQKPHRPLAAAPIDNWTEPEGHDKTKWLLKLQRIKLGGTFGGTDF